MEVKFRKKKISACTEQELQEDFNYAIRHYYSVKKNKYFDRASDEMGIWESDYYAPDGRALADLSGWKNEDEIWDRAKEYYIEELQDEDLDSGLLCDILEYCPIKMGDALFYKMRHYMTHLPYKSFKDIF